MARLLLLAQRHSYRITPFIQAAHQLKLALLLVSEGKYSPVVPGVTGIFVEFSQPEAALQKILAAIQPNEVIAVVGTDDRTLELAAQLAQQLGLPHNEPGAVRLARRKDLARDCLQQAGVAIPGYRRLDLRSPLAPQVQGLRYPCVLKPLALSASRGVIRCNNQTELAAAARCVGALLHGAADPEEARFALLEDYVPGFEVALEGLLRQGNLHPLRLFDKPDPLEGPYFEETYYISPSRLSAVLQAQIHAVVAAACQAFGLREGPIHAELRYDGKTLYILEVAARTIGGECARLLHYGLDENLEFLVLASAMGLQPAIPQRQEGVGVLMIPIPRAGIFRRIEGLSAARRVRFIEELIIDIPEGYELVPLPKGSSYLGFIFAHAPTAPLAEAALREAHACLRIVTAPLFALQPL